MSAKFPDLGTVQFMKIGTEIMKTLLVCKLKTIPQILLYSNPNFLDISNGKIQYEKRSGHAVIDQEFRARLLLP